MPDKYILFRWPWSQAVMGLEGAILIDNESPEGDILEGLDSAYMVTEKTVNENIGNQHVLNAAQNADGKYLIVRFPDSQAHLEDKDILQDYDGNVFVPIDGE